MKHIPIFILVALFLGWSVDAQATPVDVGVTPIGGATVGGSGELIPISGGIASGSPLLGVGLAALGMARRATA